MYITFGSKPELIYFLEMADFHRISVDFRFRRHFFEGARFDFVVSEKNKF